MKKKDIIDKIIQTVNYPATNLLNEIKEDIDIHSFKKSSYFQENVLGLFGADGQIIGVIVNPDLKIYNPPVTEEHHRWYPTINRGPIEWQLMVSVKHIKDNSYLAFFNDYSISMLRNGLLLQSQGRVSKITSEYPSDYLMYFIIEGEKIEYTHIT